VPRDIEVHTPREKKEDLMPTPRKLLAILAVAWLAACTSQKEPAEQTTASIEASLEEIRADAQQYAAEQLQAADASVNRLKGHLARQDYSAVMQTAPSVRAELAALRTTVTEGKANAESVAAAAQQEWDELNAAVPPLVEKLQARVDQLARTRKYPKGMDKAAYEAARSGFEGLKAEWTEATAEFAAGEAASAVRKARNAKVKAEELIDQLEVPA
jgi:hypothetical protein